MSPFDEHSLRECNVLYHRLEPKTNIWIGVVRFMFTFAVVNHLKQKSARWITFEGRWCYQDHTAASLAALIWEGEGDPPGPWIKYKGTGPERHNPIIFDHKGGCHYVRNNVHEAATWSKDALDRLRMAQEGR